MSPFDQTLVEHGADLESLRRFDEDSADLLPYATLLSARRVGDDDLAALRGAYEWQGSPLVFLIDGETLRDERQLRAIRRRLAMRGDAPYLGVVRPGQLEIHRVALDADAPELSRLSLELCAASARSTFAHLGNHRPGLVAKHRWISDVVLKLLSESITDLINRGVSDQDAISLVGRALFTRFLGDRNLLPDALTPGGKMEHLFDSPEQAEETCRWLDDTFNGDLLLLPPECLHRLPPAAFATLGNILRRAPGGQLYLEWREDWAHLDFAHIPVGVLSQAYEHYLREHSPDKQRKEGGYYTPRLIADLMVRGAFHALRREGSAHDARVLDPAAGAGVFLLTAFRQLVAERWRHDGVRPNTEILRQILYRQVTGFDINEAGLRFAALGLYLLSIELDPQPEPVQKLGFENLRGRVLLKVGEQGSLGSLGDGVEDEHCDRYDLVIGNPPWASSTQLTGWQDVRQRVARIAKSRLPKNGPTPRLPNEVLDLPFVWRAMEWAKAGGQIAFALHARLMFQQGEGMPEARAALFGALDITGVVNGAALRHSRVWPEISAPFCLLYARNRTPLAGAGFRFVSPNLEDALHGSGGLRLDAGNAEVVTGEQVAQRPEILKILFRGGPLSLEVFDRMAARGIGTLAEYWQGRFGMERGRLRFAGNGYQKLRESSRVRKIGDGEPGASAAYLADLPELTAMAAQCVLVNATSLGEFRQKRIHDPRPREIFRGPLLIVRKSAPAHSRRIQVTVSDSDVLYNTTYYGYSGHQHENGGLLIRYLALCVGSKLALWFTLVTSGEFGFERETIEKFSIDRLPVPSFEHLSPTALEQILPLFDEVARQNDEAAWAQVDAWVADLCGLRPRDLEVIDDTLRFNLPFAANRRAAQAFPSTAKQGEFCIALEEELRPWAHQSGKTLRVSTHELPGSLPWGLLRVEIGPTAIASGTLDAWPEVLRIADQLASTEILYPDPSNNTLWVARLAQARYWSRSAARLLARRIVWEHADRLFSSETA